MPSLKPRYSAWISGGAEWLAAAVLTGVAVAVAVRDGTPIADQFPFYALAIVLLVIGLRARAIWRERANPPPVLRFWDNTAGFALEVRRLHTDEVLLRRRHPHLQYASLQGAKLSGADLRGIGLKSAKLRRADLRGADLRESGLEGADLRQTDLRRARLNGANLSGARFGGANLCGADLWGAEITNSNELSAADFRGARYDETTRWPTGFDPERQRCRLTESGGDGLPIPATHPPGDRVDLPLPASTNAVETQVNRTGREHL